MPKVSGMGWGRWYNPLYLNLPYVMILFHGWPTYQVIKCQCNIYRSTGYKRRYWKSYLERLKRHDQAAYCTVLRTYAGMSRFIT